MVSLLKKALAGLLLLTTSVGASAAANCFAHTSVQLGGSNVSAPMNDTGATVLLAFTTNYGGYTTIKDVVGGPNTWYHIGNWGLGSLTGLAIVAAINPITNAAATFKNAGGQNVPGVAAASQIWACNGVNVNDLVYKASGFLEWTNAGTIYPGIAATDTVIPLRVLPVSPVHNGDYLQAQTGSIQEYMLITDASNLSSLVVQRGMFGTTAQAWADNQAVRIGSGVGLPSCQAPSAIAPSAVGDLEFTAAARAGTGAPPTQTTTATVNTAGFSTPVVVGGMATGTAGTVAMAWRVASDMSSFQPTWTLSTSDQWTCVNLVVKADTSPSAPEPAPLVHTVVGNGYQCNYGYYQTDCTTVAPGDGGDPRNATLNWPSEMIWYRHNVPADKVMVFVDNQANLIRAVNFDTVPHTVANVVIQPNTIQRIAGTGAYINADGGCTGNGGPALSAQMAHPASVMEDSQGNLAVGDQQCGSMDVIDTAGNFHWAAGGGSGGAVSGAGCGAQTRHGNRINVPATTALLNCVQGGDYDANDNMLIGDNGNQRIVFVNTGSTPVNAYGVSNIQPGYVVAIAGNGLLGCTASYTPQPALSVQMQPMAIQVVRSTGVVIIGSTYCNQIYKLTPDGNIVLLAGVDESTNGGIRPPLAYSPDGSPAKGAGLYYPFKASFEADGLIHFTDTGGNSMRHIDAQGLLRTDVGNFDKWGPKRSYMGGGWFGEGGSASNFQLNYPIGYAYDSSFHLCVASTMSNIIACEYGAVSPPPSGPHPSKIMGGIHRVGGKVQQ